MANDIWAGTLNGRTTGDIELKQKGEWKFADFSLVGNYTVKEGNDYIQKAQFIKVKLFGRDADYASKYIKKGSPVSVSGNFIQEEWKDKNGNEKKQLVFSANNIQSFAFKKDSNVSENYEGGSYSSEVDISDNTPF
jgi:single stranded DNA-binding protein